MLCDLWQRDCEINDSGRDALHWSSIQCQGLVGASCNQGRSPQKAIVPAEGLPVESRLQLSALLSFAVSKDYVSATGVRLVVVLIIA